ncbi:hypothetical protein EVAR_84811_1 [Eumeta japonica]|uniref:Uncharacterized protein n=1 Tax=Eumeta variegata TaxID=151549 RepID=A0A4C1U894_EUMVA|nr:hypothetical protein EVAR_84811_1 [Eumeta japonica]
MFLMDYVIPSCCSDRVYNERGGGGGDAEAFALQPSVFSVLYSLIVYNCKAYYWRYPIFTQEIGKALVTSLVLQTSMGGRDHLQPGGSHAGLPLENAI